MILGVELQVGVGEMIRNTSSCLEPTNQQNTPMIYISSKKRYYDFGKIDAVENLSFDVYEELLEEVYNSIVSKDKKVYDRSKMY